MTLHTLLLLAVAIGAVFLALRGADIVRGARRTHRGLLIACALASLLGATAAVYLARDPLMCPAGYGAPDAARTRTTSGKGGMKVVCTSSDGVTKDGSIFAGLFAWIAAGALLFGGGLQLLRPAGVQPVAPPAAPLPPIAPPTDKKDRRRARKAGKRPSS